MVLLDFHPTQGFMIGAGCVTYSVYLYSAWPIKQETPIVVKSTGENNINNNNNESQNTRSSSNNSNKDDDDASFPLMEKSPGKSTSQQLAMNMSPSKSK